MLGACAVGGPVEQPAEAPVGPTVPGADGTPLVISAWPVEQPKAVILGLHGYGDYGPSTFGSAAVHWAGQGIATYAIDQRGFGRNPSKGFWPGAEALVDDAVAVAAEVRRAHPCTPLVAIGHSMGGGVALAAAGKGLDADALVLAAPAIWGGEELGPAYRGLAWGAAAVIPDKRLSGEGVVEILASDNLEALYALGRDPYYLSPPSPREILGLVRITDMAAEAAATVETPALMLLGAKDQIVPEEAVGRVFSRLAGPTQTIRYDDGWHMLLIDLQAAKVWQDVADYALAAPRPACR